MSDIIAEAYINIRKKILEQIEEQKIHEFVPSEELFPYYKEVPKNIRHNIAYRKKILDRCKDDQEFRKDILRKCKKDLLYYVNTFVWTYSPKDKPDDPVQPFVTYNYQDYVLQQILVNFGKEDIVIVKSRDMGATWMVLAAIDWAWHFHKAKSFLLVSRKEEYVDKHSSPRELFWKLDFIHKYQPDWMKPPYRNSQRPKDPNRRRKSLINSINGSTISGEATVEDVARGDRQTAIFIDEAAAITELEKINAATRDATNCRIFVSTPKGHGTFEQLVNLAAKHNRLIVLHWSLHPIKSKGLYEYHAHNSGPKFFIIKGRSTQDDIPLGYEFIADGRLRSIWYDHEWTRTTNKKEIAQELDIDFHQSGGPIFSIDELQRLIGMCRLPRRKVFIEEVDFEDIRITESEFGLISVWEDPSATSKYYIGVDSSAGTGNDTSSNSSCQVIDVETKEIVAEAATNDMMIEEFARMIKQLAIWYNHAYVIWEANGYGMAFGKYLMKELQYPYVYMRRQVTRAIEKITNMPGWWSSVKEKQLLLTQFFIAVRTGQVKINSRDLVAELGEYVYTESGQIEHIRKRGEGSHGDRVIAAALSYRGASDFLFVKRKEEKTEPNNFYCYAYRKRLHRLKEEAESW
ncbi:MAG: hypothetical protein KatS3mg087_1139 [Patescibacteria group bacterium]|nr:MAG: hypothetical protein KatS3mg087_1139 [Patescibacteria group bacterium]